MISIEIVLYQDYLPSCTFSGRIGEPVDFYKTNKILSAVSMYKWGFCHPNVTVLYKKIL